MMAEEMNMFNIVENSWQSHNRVFVLNFVACLIMLGK